MKQKLAIARTLLHRPALVFFDEPTAGLDPINANNVSRFITRLRDDAAMTAIVVTHDLHHAFAVASRIVLLDLGEIIFEGTVEEL